jgi:hypothetical protein
MLWAIAALLTAASLGHAGPVGPLTTFTAGTPAKASEVNGNFTAVKTAVDDNAGRIATVESTVSGGNIVLGPSTATTGNILKGATPFIHDFGTDSTFIGAGAGNLTSIALSNTGTGSRVLQQNTIGFNNTGSGASALLSNTTGSQNTAFGVGALVHNTTGAGNTAIGASAHPNNTTGSRNIIIGFEAGLNLATGNDNIEIGSQGVAFDSNTIRIGNSVAQNRTFVAGIKGVSTGIADAIPVVVDSNGQLGTISSSRRVKDDIADMGNASNALMKLRPVIFHYKSDKNPKGRTLQYGLVAEDVAKVAPGLVAHSADGQIETVYYQFLAPMLLNEYQKQQRTIEAQTAELTKRKLEIAELRQQTARIAELEKQVARTTATLERLEQKGMIATAGR